MWRPSFLRTSFFLRVGRARVELWRADGERLEQLAHAVIDDASPPNPATLAAPIAQVLSGAELKGASKSAIALHAVLESAWLPVVPLSTGGALWSGTELDALLRHRLSQAHDDESTLTAEWDIRIEHRPGDDMGFGYALNPAVKAAVLSAASAAGHVVRSVQPAFNWAWQRSRRERRRQAAGSPTAWWIWREQDRALAACVVGGQVCALNPAAPLPCETTSAARLVEQESARFGITSAGSTVLVSGWDDGAEH